MFRDFLAYIGGATVVLCGVALVAVAFLAYRARQVARSFLDEQQGT